MLHKFPDKTTMIVLTVNDLSTLKDPPFLHFYYNANIEKERLDGYFCLNGGQTKVTVCPDSNRISKNELLDILLPLIRMEFALYLNNPGSYMEYGEDRIAESIKKQKEPCVGQKGRSDALVRRKAALTWTTVREKSCRRNMSLSLP